jgi:hypothetical protein
MGKIYTGKLTPAAFVATSEAAGYPASNVGSESVAMPWKATSTGANDFTITWPSAQTVAAILVNDVNFASCPVQKSPDAAAYSAAGVLTTYADKLTGRRRGLIVINDANVRGIKLQISGTPTDAIAWRIGALYPFSIETAMPRMPEYGASVRGIFPGLRNELPNGQVAQASTGEDVLVISMQFDRRYDEDALELMRRARIGAVGLSLAPDNFPELVLPVRFYGEQQGETLAHFDYAESTLELREAA